MSPLTALRPKSEHHWFETEKVRVVPGVVAVRHELVEEHGLDLVADVDAIPVERELQARQRMRQRRRPDQAERSRGCLLRERSGLPPSTPEVDWSGSTNVGSSAAGRPCARHSASTPAPSGPRALRAPDGAGVDEGAIVNRRRSWPEAAAVKLEHARRPYRFLVGAAHVQAVHRLVEQLRLPRVETACRGIVGRAISKHRLERADAGNVSHHRHEQLHVQVEIVVVAIDVVRGAEPLDVGRSVREGRHWPRARRCTRTRLPCRRLRTRPSGPPRAARATGRSATLRRSSARRMRGWTHRSRCSPCTPAKSIRRRRD